MIKLREKISSHGIKSLKTEELIAVILGNGIKGQNVLELARGILSQSEDLQLNLNQLMKNKGVGIAQACKVLAALELGDRKLKADKLPDRIMELSILGKHLIKKIGSSPQEKLIAVYLDNSNHIIMERIVFIGTIDSATVHPRDIMRDALSISARRVVIAHNHPSGNLKPSKNDQDFSLRLQECCQLIGIGLVDHLIITRNSYLSMKSSNLI
ncbi:RadC family protein [Companilactobacillus kedongensis]|uniref:RadC family protein n=1 Tax=Companilactobacillus kedongensis TaxID=2486004 RepID=UPI000F7B2999|nr:DNA repair protein RadC [Companilactobacillus kedongensis]